MRQAVRKIFRREAVFAWLLALAFVTVLRPSIRGNDGVQNYAYLRSLLVDGDLDFANEYAHYYELSPDWFNRMPIAGDPVTRRPINLYGVGCSLLWAPWVAVAHGLVTGAHSLGLPAPPPDGYSWPYEAAVGIASCFYASLGLLLVHRMLRARFGEEAGLWAMLVVWLASPLLFYMYLHPSMSHANSFFLSAVLLVLYLGGDGAGRWGVMGGAAGLLVTTRFQDAALLALFLPGECGRLRASWRERLPRYGLFALAFAFCILPQLAAWNVLQGSPFSGPRAYLNQGTVRPWAPVYALDVMLSPRHGLLYWHPALLVGIAGLLARRGDFRLQLAGLAAFAAQWWVVSSWSMWSAGASFGHRMFISTLPMLALGAALLLAGYPRAGKWLRPAILFLVLWNFGYVIQYGSGMISRQDGVPLGELARNNLVGIPRMVFEKLSR